VRKRTAQEVGGSGLEVTINFDDAEWARIEVAFIDQVGRVDADSIAAFLRTTAGNVVRRYERNQSFNQMVIEQNEIESEDTLEKSYG
jgi:hypothetical protein